MGVARLQHIPGFNIDRVAAAAGSDPDVLRLENLDTDVPPPPEAIEATRSAIGTDEANSWLPFTGRDDLKEAVAAYIERRGGPRYDGPREVVITSGEGDAMLDALFCLTDPGDEVVLTDPTYAGMLNRVRLVGAVPRLVPLHVAGGEWRLDLDALAERSRTGRASSSSTTPRSRRAGSRARRSSDAIASLCCERDVMAPLLGRVRGRPLRRPHGPPPGGAAGDARPDGHRRRPVVEQRLIAWRIGWVVAPGDLVNDVSRVQIYNGLVPSGFAQIGVRVALELEDDGLAAANAEWQRRRDEMLRQLQGLPVVRPAGAWSLLLDVASLGLDCVDVSNRLLAEKVAATPMRGWGGPIADRHVRFVFSNEPVERLAVLGDRVRRALDAAATER